MIDLEAVLRTAQENIEKERAAFERTTPHVRAAVDVANLYIAERSQDSIRVSFSSIYHLAVIDLAVGDIRAAIYLIRRLIENVGYRSARPAIWRTYGWQYVYAIDTDNLPHGDIEINIRPPLAGPPPDGEE